jgi:hypothetical protein
MTRARSGAVGTAGAAQRATARGTAYESVLPEPVGEATRRSRGDGRTVEKVKDASIAAAASARAETT